MGVVAQDEVVGLEDAASLRRIVVEPGAVSGIEYAPPRCDRREARLNPLESCFFNQWNLLGNRRSSRARVPGAPAPLCCSAGVTEDEVGRFVAAEHPHTPLVHDGEPRAFVERASDRR